MAVELCGRLLRLTKIVPPLLESIDIPEDETQLILELSKCHFNNVKPSVFLHIRLKFSSDDLNTILARLGAPDQVHRLYEEYLDTEDMTFRSHQQWWRRRDGMDILRTTLIEGGCFVAGIELPVNPLTINPETVRRAETEVAFSTIRLQYSDQLVVDACQLPNGLWHIIVRIHADESAGTDQFDPKTAQFLTTLKDKNFAVSPCNSKVVEVILADNEDPMVPLRHPSPSVDKLPEVFKQYVREYEQKQQQRFNEDWDSAVASLAADKRTSAFATASMAKLSDLIAKLQVTHYGQWLVLYETSHDIYNTEKEARQRAAQLLGAQAYLLRGILDRKPSAAYSTTCRLPRATYT